MTQIVHILDFHNPDCSPVTPSFKRQDWLDRTVEALRAKFAAVGYVIPDKLRFSIGWPRYGSGCGRVGECWSSQASSDEHSEIFISPALVDGAEILETLAHELAHATVGAAAGHGEPFKHCAVAIGLTGPMRSTVAGREFAAWSKALIARIGPYPGGSLSEPPPKQSTRLLKCECRLCGYTVRVARSWLRDAGPPICPTDRIPMLETGGAP